MNNSFILLLSLVFLTVAPFLPSARAADAQAADREKLVGELQSVRADVDKAEKDLASNNKNLWQKQHDLEYKDPEIVALREEIVALEKQLIEKRKQLQVRLALKPEIKKIEAQRKELFKNVQDLRDKEAAIQREISAHDNAAQLEN